MVPFERTRNDNSRTLHVLDKFCELLVCLCVRYSSGEFNHNKSAKGINVCAKETIGVKWRYGGCLEVCQ